jgi:serine/threonine-protein kinase
MSVYTGLVLFNYRLTRVLGEGGFGVVYEAVHEQIGRRAAVKILHPAYARHPEVVARFFNEAQAACAIGHPAIIDITNYGRLDSGEPFIMMDFVAGASLAQRVAAQGPITLADVATIFAPVASALTAAHAKGVIHRDLKPDNVMVVAQGDAITAIKLLDFGIAKLTDAAHAEVSTRAGSIMGTPNFMAPEQAVDAKRVDARADVYGFGATVLAALTGQPPFDADSVTALLMKVVSEPAPALRTRRPDLPVALETAIARCLDKDPGRRPQTIDAAWREISAALAPVSGLGVGPIAPRADSAPARSRRTVVAVALGAVGGAALVAGVIAALGNGGGAPPAPPVRADARAVDARVIDARVVAPVDPAIACAVLEPAAANPVLGALPRPALPLSAPDIDGNVVDLAQLRGHVVLMSFQASWAGTARHEITGLTPLATAIGPDLVIVRVASEDSRAGAVAVIEPGARYRTIIDPPTCGGLGAITSSWGVQAVPESYLIDRAGTVRFYFNNARPWNSPEAIACVQALVDEPAAAPAAAPPTPPGTGTALPCPTVTPPVVTDPTPAEPPPASDPAHEVRGTITIAPRLAAQVPIGGVVFVVAKHVGADGRAAGSAVAVGRLVVDGGPLAFDLAPLTTPLSGELVVSAFYDQDGDGMTHQKGDIRGEVRVTVPTHHARIVLDTVVP